MKQDICTVFLQLHARNVAHAVSAAVSAVIEFLSVHLKVNWNNLYQGIFVINSIMLRMG